MLFDSDSGDYIGAGRKIVFDSSSTITSDKSTSTHIAISVGNGNDSFTLDFSAPRGTSFTSTGSLAGATRYPFNSPQRPGLSVSGDGRGCNQLSGWFQITEVVFATSGQLARLSLDFKQNCENGSSALYGAVRINTDAPLAIPPLKAIAGVAQSAYPNDTIALDGSSSFSRPSSALSYSWTQVSGQHVDITGQNSSLVTFTTPLELAGGENLVFQLLTTTAAGTTDADRISVHVASRNDPQTYVQLVSDSGDYIGGGSTTRLTPADGDLSFASNNRSGVTATYNGSDFYSLQFGPASSTPFTVGAYENAQRFAFADKSAPGMDVNGAGRGCNTITGRFDLLDIVTTANGPSRVALNFEQHCEGATPALRGQVRYNYIAKGVPIADAGADSTVMPGDNVILDGTASHDDVGITSYQWTQVSGPTVLLQGDKTSRASFAAPTVNPPQTLEFRLLVGDADDLAAADRKVVTVSTSPPPVTPPPSTTPVPSTPTSSGGGGGGAMSPLMAAIFIFFAGASRRRRFLPR